MTDGKKLLISHSLVFLVRFAAAKSTDYDELSNYRDAHEGLYAKWRRRAGSVGIGAFVLGTVVVAVQLQQKVPKQEQRSKVQWKPPIIGS
jgi:hypothetical protein